MCMKQAVLVTSPQLQKNKKAWFEGQNKRYIYGLSRLHQAKKKKKTNNNEPRFVSLQRRKDQGDVQQKLT